MVEWGGVGVEGEVALRGGIWRGCCGVAVGWVLVGGKGVGVVVVVLVVGVFMVVMDVCGMFFVEIG